MSIRKQRVDVMLVERGLAPSRERARALVLAGIVYSGERRVEKAGDALAVDAPLEVRGADHPYVSRGGVKLEGALDALHVEPRGLVCADFGASTGGFTDCLLTRGAARVHAIDVGWGQLHPKLRNDPRVIVRERTNARHLRAGELGDAIDLVVIDASFIGLGKLLPAAREVLRDGGSILAMVKPQFEVDRRDLHKGVVRDAAARIAAIEKVEAEARALGLEVIGRCDSQLAGPDGNVEAFLHLRRPAA
ncbi:TlyA family RNA methyltransferase [Sandaracinus amylolyticus]|uniref:RNA binding methyltransferase FtsJ like protein n=1 Tax=Sandaracinus amylolyticus TaxID=927083 RepID=A0A0F6YMD7_9BACT|nr:TlyA family RNA methyltransferase [Sandaracinus amylolyticus]AKF10653.1 RNA binding methyltransferase FtsJ like protein [Sandaracinus amylolyticus]